jgi:hypothetical protein
MVEDRKRSYRSAGCTRALAGTAQCQDIVTAQCTLPVPAVLADKQHTTLFYTVLRLTCICSLAAVIHRQPLLLLLRTSAAVEL